MEMPFKGQAMLKAINQKADEGSWRSPQTIRQRLLDWYREEGVVMLQPWAKQKDNGEEISEQLRAWRVFLGELLVSQLPFDQQMQFWQLVLNRWPDHESFLNDAEPSRRRIFRSRHLEKNENLLQQVAIQLKEALDWREWVRTDITGISRDRIRKCLAMVGITADRSCSVSLGRFVSKIMQLDSTEKTSTRQHRELQLGLLLGGDHDGKIYRAAIAASECKAYENLAKPNDYI